MWLRRKLQDKKCKDLIKAAMGIYTKEEQEGASRDQEDNRTEVSYVLWQGTVNQK